MTRKQKLMDHLTGQNNVEALIRLLSEQFEEFADIREQYTQSMQLLKKELGEDPVNAEENAILQQTASDLLFSGILGIKANLNNFINPIARNFLDVDSEIYLREDIAHSLPTYEDAQKVRDHFYASLTAEQRKTYDTICTYVSYLETVGPKLAHYYGYLFGNELLPRIIPSYHTAPVLTMQYNRMLEEYLGKKIPE